ncbi:hypothetical protein LBMAG53_06210 [Planctomycetota bacterium]|nr:hypothetical protein LBMAG53_06210 [Planctomycetota bacterium]
MTDDELLDRHFLGDGTVRAALAQRMAADAAMRAAFVARSRFETILRRACIQQSSAVHTPLRPGRPASGWWLAAAAAVLVIGVGSSAWLFRNREPEPFVAVVNGTVLADGQAVRTAQSGTALVVGDAPAAITLVDGSTATLSAASRLTFHERSGKTRATIELASGRGSFAIAKGPDQVHVTTAVGRVVVLGTRFSVAANPAQRTMDVSVDEGRVEVQVGDERVLLTNGERRSFIDPAVRSRRSRDGLVVATSDGRLAVRSVREGEGAVEQLVVARDADLVIDGRPASLLELPPGSRIRYVIEDDLVIALTAHGQLITAKVASVEPDALLVSTTGQQQPLRLELDPLVEVAIDGRPAGISQISIGSKASLLMSTDGRRVMAVTVATPKADLRSSKPKPGKPGADRLDSDGPARPGGP